MNKFGGRYSGGSLGGIYLACQQYRFPVLQDEIAQGGRTVGSTKPSSSRDISGS